MTSIQQNDLVFNDSINESMLLAFPVPLSLMPDGWLSPTEMRILYTLAQQTHGPVLEIGAWLGRSTLAIAAGVRDSPNIPAFDTCDFGLTSIGEWSERLQESFEPYLKDVENDIVVRSIFQTGGSIALLIDNLRKANLLKYVTSIIRGNALEVPLRNQYGFIFCDTLHYESEIRTYGAFLNNLLADGGWIVCDDVISEELGSILREYIDFEFLVYSLPIDQYSKFAVGKKRKSLLTVVD
jgi:predicted O-methyltransferase YrrM